MNVEMAIRNVMNEVMMTEYVAEGVIRVHIELVLEMRWIGTERIELVRENWWKGYSLHEQ